MIEVGVFYVWVKERIHWSVFMYEGACTLSQAPEETEGAGRVFFIYSARAMEHGRLFGSHVYDARSAAISTFGIGRS